jgi:ubiquinone/menaquinone biosynthesis C-methylase UbiE
MPTKTRSAITFNKLWNAMRDEVRAGRRAWQTVFEALPPLHGKTVLDVGCGPGDQAAEFVARGARVIGIDMNEDLLREARSKRLAGAEFRRAGLRELGDVGAPVDGIWCGFTAAYFPDLHEVLEAWGTHLLGGGSR